MIKQLIRTPTRQSLTVNTLSLYIARNETISANRKGFDMNMNSPNEMSTKQKVLVTAFAAATIALSSTSLSNEHDGEQNNQGYTNSVLSLLNPNNPDGTPKVDPKYSTYSW